MVKIKQMGFNIELVETLVKIVAFIYVSKKIKKRFSKNIIHSVYN